MDLLYAAHVPAGEGPFPTVFALHGWGANAQDLLGLAPLLPGGRFLTLCPQGPVTVPIAPGHTGYGWFPLVRGQPPDPQAFLAGAGAVHGFFEQVQRRYPVDPRRLVALGFSQGGLMAYDLALRAPERFAGLVVLSSWLPDLLAEDLPTLASQQGFPVLVLHGRDDPMVEVARARSSRALLERMGVDLAYHELDMGHEIRPEALGILGDWLRRHALGEGR